MGALRRVSLIQGPPGPPGLIEVVGNWTPGTVTAGAIASTTVALANAVPGLPAWAAASPALAAGCVLFAQCPVAGSVRVDLVNLTGTSQTPGILTLTVEALTS